MTDAVKVLASSPFDRRLLRKARKSEVDAWDFTDMQWSGALEQVTRLDPWGRDLPSAGTGGSAPGGQAPTPLIGLVADEN